jgi:hypothetical protein
VSKEIYVFPVDDWHNPVLVRSDAEPFQIIVLGGFSDREEEQNSCEGGPD